jgi:hypothetical protein
MTNYKPLEDVVAQWTLGSPNDVEYIIEEPKPNNIIMNVGTAEMLRVAEDGFYVRGIKVEQDDREAEIVYNAFKQFIVWSRLNQE